MGGSTNGQSRGGRLDRVVAVAGLLVLALAFGWYWTAARGGTSRPLSDLLGPPVSPAGWSIEAAPVEPVAAFPLSGVAPATASAYREGARVVWQLAGQRQPEVEWLHVAVTLHRFADAQRAAAAADALATQNAAELARAGLTEGTVVEVDGWPLSVRRAVTGKEPDQLRGWSLVTYELAAEALPAALRAVAVPVQSLRSHELTLVLVFGETVASVSVQASDRAVPVLRDLLGQVCDRLALERTVLDRVPLSAN
ncbi:hypothetical protein OO015_11120 [Thermomicrobium sp. 4228-Ro]|uniref:hypothetical protein n=1 Tax=Thermomicrobium sp. 4228-Ro TaxID=2993937 RepID=UPI0022488F7F|nr:hypothetical protein [Thermomicrobium sp. 4228-Ro]MCX2728041.1 hypothetical protein [Thermomicrobium sp. 4228-Ro]